jgi:hypothetical protein
MSDNNTVIRSLHDAGLAAWFGGSLMGAVGLNGATANAHDPQQRLALAHHGWTRWAPVNAAAIGSYLAGSIGMLAADSGRIARQPGAGAATAAKTALSAAALGLTAYSWKLNRAIAPSPRQPAEGATEPAPDTDDTAAAAQKQLRVLQWLIPGVTGGLVVLQALHGEQQRRDRSLAERAKQLKKVLPGV